MMGGGRIITASTRVFCLVGAASLGVSATAQDDGGFSLTLDVGINASTDTNLALDPVSAGQTSSITNTLSLGLLSETRTESFAIGLDGALRAVFHPGGVQTFGFEDPGAFLKYTRDAANSRLQFNAKYDQSDLAYLDWTLDDDGDRDDAFINDSGTRITYSAGGEWETGLEAPLGLRIAVNHTVVDYVDTTSTDLYDSATSSANATLRFDLNPRTTANLNLNYDYYDADDSDLTMRHTRALSLGVTHEVSPVSTLEASIGHTWIDTDFGGGAPSTSSAGFTASASWTQQVANGTWALAASHSLKTSGGYTTIKATRDMPLPSGSLGYSLGVAFDNTGTPHPSGSVSLVRALPTGALSLSLEHKLSAGTDDAVTSSASASYRHEINPVSSIAFGVDVESVRDAGSGGVTGQLRGTVSASYSHQLTRDVDLTVGYGYDYYDSDTTSPANNHSLFFGVERSFKFRP